MSKTNTSYEDYIKKYETNPDFYINKLIFAARKRFLEGTQPPVDEKTKKYIENFAGLDKIEKMIIQGIAKEKKYEDIRKDIEYLTEPAVADKASEIFQLIRYSLKILDPKEKYTVNKQKLALDVATFLSRNTMEETPVTNSTNDVGNDLETIFKNVLQKYEPTILARCGKVEILGIPTQNRRVEGLEDFFVKPQLIFSDSDNPDRDFDDFEEELRLNQIKLICTSEPGCGKTFLLKHLALIHIDKKRNFEKIPIYLSIPRVLKWAPLPNIDISDELQKRLENLSIMRSDFITLANEGKFIFLFDSLEPDSRIFTPFQDFIETFSKNSFVFSCRSKSITISEFKNFTIEKFDIDRQEKFINKWLEGNTQKNETDRANFINDLLNKDYNDLRSSPLGLQILCLALENSTKNLQILNYNYPKNIVIIYQEALNSLILKDNMFKPESLLYKKLDLSNKISLISYIAFRSIKDQIQYIPFVLIKKYILDFFKGVEIETTLNDSQLYSLLNDIEYGEGLLIDRLYEEYSFFHKTIHNFLASVYISRHPEIWEQYFSEAEKFVNSEWISRVKLINNQAKELLEANTELYNYLSTHSTEAPPVADATDSVCVNL